MLKKPAKRAPTAQRSAPTAPKTSKAPARTATSRTPKQPEPAPELLALKEQVEQLSAALSSRPTWDDLRSLENRMSAWMRLPADSEALMQLQEQLQTRQEELEELSGIVSEFQEQNEQAQRRLQQMTGQLQNLAEELDETRQQLELSQQQRHQAEQRTHLAEGFLREALLGLLSPGDEFNEELVEQIQHFLSL
jgi:chromosome segregation ATPase